MTTLKERAIVLTSYERRALFRFLMLYLASVFMLLAIIGYLFFENNRAAMQSAMKFEMMYQGRMLSSEIVMKAMMRDGKRETFDLHSFLQGLNDCRFAVGYYDKHKKPLFTQIDTFKVFEKPFSTAGDSCYSVVEDPNEHLGVRYLVLKESELGTALQQLRIQSISYLLLSFIVMGVVGYFLGRLFLQPVREKIESLNRFISDTTHELNTPVSAILMTIESLKGIEEKKMARLRASAKRLSVMYRSLTYRLEGKEEQNVKLCMAEVLKERVAYMKELIDAKHLVVTVEATPLWVMMSPRSANRLIDNLLSNAIKYSDVGGEIIFTLKAYSLTIADRGIGIAHEAQADIFKRYKRANEDRGGFGIGLSIVLAICEKYGIKIALESEKRQGSTFTLTFPKPAPGVHKVRV